MRKILVSDYDDTFFVNEKDIRNNLKKVDEFRNQNNIFIIATGESYQDFQEKIDKYNIKTDYIALNHGATIIKDDKIIKNYIIADDLKEKIVKLLDIDKSISHFACSKKESRLSLKDSLLTKINVTYQTKEQADKIKAKLLDKFKEQINVYPVTSGRALEIISSQTSKKEAIKTISILENISNKDISVIGDGYNDIEMIKYYNGFCIKDAKDEVKNISTKEYESVSILIEELLNN